MPDLSTNPDDYDGAAAYAHAQALNACRGTLMPHWALFGIEGEHTEHEYAIEPARDSCARSQTDELVTAIEALPDYRNGARIITRSVSYGHWRYVMPEEIEAL